VISTQSYFLNITKHWSAKTFADWGFTEQWTQVTIFFIDFTLLLVVSYLAYFLAKRVLLRLIQNLVKRSKTEYDDIFFEKKVFNGLANLIPAIIIKTATPGIFHDFPAVIPFIEKITTVYMIVVIMMVVNRFLHAVEYILSGLERYKDKPLKSFIQVFTIVNFILGSVFIISILVGKNPLNILAGFGALTAVLLLVFKDTILGLVASIQISTNDMVRVGDWVSMDKFGADGDVLEINLTTVKVRNWDKTITTVPTYAFISDSFKNWRGMQSVGVRRIKRSINIDLQSIQFCDEQMIQRFKKLRLIDAYISQKEKEIEEDNTAKNINKEEPINGRRMTNIGVFRAFALHYLQNHPKVAQDQTIMVRQLQPTETGLPMEIYCFSNDISWVNYEGIQSDIFDYLLAAVPNFGLQIFQNPSGADFRSMKGY